MNTKKILGAALTCTLTLAMASGAAVAGPHGGPGGGPGGGHWGGHGPHWGYYNDWLLGTVAATALIAGTAAVINNANNAAVNNANNANGAATAPAPGYGSGTNPAAAPKVAYWCEAEQAYFPNVRSCLSGWTVVPME